MLLLTLTEPSLPEKKIIFLWCLCILQNFLFVLCFGLQSAYFCLPRTITLLGRFVNMWCHTGSVYITNRKILNYSQPVDTWTFQGFPGKNHVYQGFSRFLSFLFKVFKAPIWNSGFLKAFQGSGHHGITLLLWHI